MEDSLAAFKSVEAAIRKPENYVPRNYQTVGGMWTVDTWELGETTFQLMDEGYTSRLHSADLEVFEQYQYDRGIFLNFVKGNESLLKLLASKIAKGDSQEKER